MTSPRRLLATLAATALTGTLGLALVPAAPASADSRVTVTNDRGTAQADLTYRTSMTVRGSGFQVVQGGFGGVYVMFGWVRNPGSGAWRPSEGGLTGEDYQYVPDAEDAADNAGYLKFVAFPGSSTAGEAAAVLSRSGGFTVDVTVPGPTFQSVDRDGAVSEVDCREVQCGIITIGAHGVVNNRNETFTPVDFGTVYDAEPTDDPSATETTTAPVVVDPTDTAEPTAPATDVPTAGTTDTSVPVAGAPVLDVDRATAVAGHALAFTARGFTPGEQVVGVLDDGAASIGPMVAGASGEIAGVLQLLPDLAVGTHELRLTGAASTLVATALFPVSAGDDAVTVATDAAAADDAGSSSDDGNALPYVFLLVAAAALLVSVAVRRAIHRRRRSGRPAPPAVAPGAPS